MLEHLTKLLLRKLLVVQFVQCNKYLEIFVCLTLPLELERNMGYIACNVFINYIYFFYRVYLLIFSVFFSESWGVVDVQVDFTVFVRRPHRSSRDRVKKCTPKVSL